MAECVYTYNNKEYSYENLVKYFLENSEDVYDLLYSLDTNI